MNNADYSVVFISEKPNPKFGNFDGIVGKIMKYLDFKKERNPVKDGIGADFYGLRNGLHVYVHPKEDNCLKLEVHGNKDTIDKSIDAVVKEYGGLITVFHYSPKGNNIGIDVYFGGKEKGGVDAEGNMKFSDGMVLVS